MNWGDEQLEVLSVKQPLTPRGLTPAEVLATFQDGRPAVVAGPAGQGRVLVLSFLPVVSTSNPPWPRLPLDRQAEEERLVAENSPPPTRLRVADQPLATSAGVSGPEAAGSLDPADRDS